MRKRPAFTIVELLVVIAVLVVIVALLLPTVRKVREQALSVQCLSNLRQSGLAISAYAFDFGYVIPHHTNYYQGHGRVWRQFVIGKRSDIMRKAYIDDLGVTLCPKNSGGSYGNIAVQHDGENGTGPQHTFTYSGPSWSFYGIRVAAIGRPSDYVYLADTGCYTKANASQTAGVGEFFSERSGSSTLVSSSALWLAHPNETANAWFIDGHAENCSKDRLKSTSNANYNSGNGRQGISTWRVFRNGRWLLEDLTIP